MNSLIIDATYYRIAAYKSWQEGDKFFNQYNLFNYIENGRYSELMEIGIAILEYLKNIDEKAYIKIHKGTPFYWMGMASYLMRDFTIASNLFDLAVSEDINNKDDSELRNSPSILFALLDDTKAEQAARPLVINAVDSIKNFLDIYNDPIHGKNQITIEFIRKNFFERNIYEKDYSSRSLTTSLISFFLEWNYCQTLINLRTQAGSEELYFLHLFKGCLLFESLLKENPIHKPPKHKDTFYKVLDYLKKDLDFNKQKIDIGNTTLDKIQRQLASLPTKFDDYIEITGRLRNTLGHNLVWNTNINAQSYQMFFSCIALSCLHAIFKLYK